MSWIEVGNTTLTQAAILQEHTPYVSPHYDTSELEKAASNPTNSPKSETPLHDFRMSPTQKESVDRFGAVFISPNSK